MDQDANFVKQIEEFASEIKRRKGRYDRNRLLLYISLAFLLLLLGVIVGGQFLEYFANVSAGFYGAGLAYWLIDRNHGRVADEFDIAKKMLQNTKRLEHLLRLNNSRISDIETTAKRIKSLRFKLEGKVGSDRRKLEYYLLQMTLTYLPTILIVRQQFEEIIDAYKNIKDILIQLDLMTTANTLSGTAALLRYQLEQFEKRETDTFKQVSKMMNDFEGKSETDE